MSRSVLKDFNIFDIRNLNNICAVIRTLMSKYSAESKLAEYL